MSEITPNTPNPVREDAYKQQLAAKLGIDPQYIPGSPIWHSEEEIAAIAEMFANMSGGSSGGGVLVVGTTMSDNKVICDKTCKEMWDAMKTGGVLVDATTFVYTIVNAQNDNTGYTFTTYNNIIFKGSDDNDNPSSL